MTLYVVFQKGVYRHDSLYVVFQEGVYRHDCGGVYDTLDGAIAAADDMAAEDRDDYHWYEVLPFELNTREEGDKVYSVKRSEALAKRSRVTT